MKLSVKDFEGLEFKLVMASNTGTNLSLCFRDSCCYFKIQGKGQEIEKPTLGQAVRVFNELRERKNAII